MSLLDILRPRPPQKPKDARVVALAGFNETTERRKQSQRKYWLKNDRRKK